MSFPLALSVGIEGERELMELAFDGPITAQAVRERLAAQLPQGVRVRSVEALGPNERARVAEVAYVESLRVDDRPEGQSLRVAFKVTPQGTGNPKDILRLLGVATAPGAPAPRMARTSICLAPS